MTAEERIDRFRRFIEAWTTGNLGTIDEMMAPDAVYHMPPFSDLSGTGQLKQFITDFHAAFPESVQVYFDEDLIAGEATVHRWNVSGIFTGRSPLLSVAPTGRLTTATGCHICHWAGDRCVEIWHFGDWLGWLQRAGAAPALDIFGSLGTFG